VPAVIVTVLDDVPEVPVYDTVNVVAAGIVTGHETYG
jgi:hypothetical protein